VHPALALLSAARASDAEAREGRLPAQLHGGASGLHLPEGPLRRMARGLRALGDVAEVAAAAPGPWCAAAPLWGNPLLQLELREEQRTARWERVAAAAAGAAPEGGAAAVLRQQWAEGFAHLVGCPGLHTVQDLVVFMRILVRMDRERELSVLAPPARRAALQRAVFGREGVVLPALLAVRFLLWSPGGVGAAGELLRSVQAAYQALPTAWVSAVVAGLPPVTQAPRPLRVGQLEPAAVQGAVGLLAGRLGWGNVSLAPPAEGSKLAAMSVKAATLLQLGPRTAAQQAARATYAADALATGAAAAVPDAAVQAGRRRLERALGGLWRVKWDNRRREVLWRLTVNGVRGAGGHGVAMRQPCKCGWAGPPAGLAGGMAARQWRSHYFWGCPVAAAVVAELQAALPPAAALLTRENVWLLRPPAGVHPGVWGVVCAAALEAMERGRRSLWAAAAAADPLECLQPRITAFLRPLGAPPAPAAAGPTAAEARAAAQQQRVGRAQRRAAAWVWCILQDFVFLHGAGDSTLALEWAGAAAGHPYLFFGTEGRLRLRLPPGLALPADI
jgi:hypothetical protein